MTTHRFDRHQCVAEALRAHEGELRRFVGARVPASDVDDVLQMGAMRALEQAEALEKQGSVRAWLFTIHRNLSTDTTRKRGRLQTVLATLEPIDSDPGYAAERCDCSVVQASKLRPSYAAMLKLIDTGGASIAEAAATLGITVNNATVRLHRARKALRDAMQAHCGVQTARDCAECRCVDDGCCVPGTADVPYTHSQEGQA